MMCQLDKVEARKPWRPLLDGREADQAWRVIGEISDALESELTKIDRDPFLGGGSSGLALYFSYLSQALDEDHYADIAAMFVERMIDDVTRLPSQPSLYGGFTGPAWTLEHLRGRLLEPDDDDEATSDVDQALIDLLAVDEWQGHYDLVSGLVGYGTYAFEARRGSTARCCLEQVVHHLERLSEKRSEGVTWFTAPELLPEHQRREFSAGCYNLGMAHGVPAVVALLGRIGASGLMEARVQQLLEPAVGWVLAQEIDAHSCFPIVVAEGSTPQASRLAWCYGDPGVVVALLIAARATGRLDWEQDALRLARRAAGRAPETAGIEDAGLCHGAAGLGHVFNRLYQATLDPAVEEAARLWFEKTLTMRQPGEGIAGYSAWWTPNGSTPARWAALPGFLMGAAGIGLALLAAVTPVEPEWDAVLMTTIPPATGG